MLGLHLYQRYVDELAMTPTRENLQCPTRTLLTPFTDTWDLARPTSHRYRKPTVKVKRAAIWLTGIDLSSGRLDTHL
jgi:hypothetical protein